jgi:PhzF family phenazine biosynthesis protein
MSFEMILVDAFTDTPYRGNPCAVCLLTEDRSREWMQKLAMEMNLSETVYVTGSEDGVWHLRYFTPTQEIELCGHATFASSHVLFERGLVEGEATLCPRLSVPMRARRDGDRIEIEFPSLPASQKGLSDGLILALGVEPLWTGRNKLKWLVEIDSCERLRAMVPDYGFLRSLHDCEGVVVTARSEMEGVDFESRFFAGPAGVDEDPVCGSAHCMLTPFWAGRLARTALNAYQCSTRGGSIECYLEGQPDQQLVRMLAPCVTVSEGRLSERAGADVVEHGTVV